MYLEPSDKDLFFKLYFDLLYCVNIKHKIVKHFGDSRFPKIVDSGDANLVREKLFENPKWIDEYLNKYGDEFTEEERNILVSWRDYYIRDTFIVIKYLTKYSVFMHETDKGDNKLYGITGLNHPFAELFDKNDLPILVAALLLPFKNKIIYDGLVSAFNVRIGPNMRKSMNESYRISKEKYGIIERLPFDDSAPRAVVKTRPKTAPAKPIQQKDEKYQEIADIINRFCEEELDAEFTEVCLFVLGKLRRKRPSPLTGGKANTWACGIVYAVCSNNFVFDRSQSYYMPAQDIADWFDLSKSTAQSKASEINKLLKISIFSPEYVIARAREQINGLQNMMRETDNILKLFE